MRGGASAEGRDELLGRRGGRLWEKRPQFCRDFHCHWILDSSFGDEWEPDKSKLVMNHRPDSNVFVVMVDPGSAGAWLREPFHSELRALADRLAQHRIAVEIVVNHDTTILTPTRTIPLGSHAGEIAFTWAKRQALAGLNVEPIDVVVTVVCLAHNDGMAGIAPRPAFASEALLFS